MNTSVIDLAIPVKITTWYNCWIQGQPTFGFAVNSKGYISDFPDRNFIGNKVSDHRNWFLNRKAEVVKIAEQIEK